MARGRPHKCPYCEATKSVAKGFRYNRDGKVRLRRCKVCGRRWTVGPAPEEPESAGVPASRNEAPADATRPEGVPPDDGDSDEQGRDGREKRQQETGEPEEARRIELPLSGGGSPSQEDPGEERKEESEETFFTQ